MTTEATTVGGAQLPGWPLSSAEQAHLTSSVAVPPTMRAVVYPEPNRFEVRDDVPVPPLGPGEALVRVMSTTICATDQKILSGQFPGTRFPHIPGHEFAGEVAAVGPAVDEVQPGDRVGVEVHVGCGRCPRCLEGFYQLCENYGRPEKGHAHIGFTVPGGLAEYALVPIKALHPLPAELTWDQGAFTDNIGIALYAVERGQLRPGESVVVVGPGAFGALAIQVARAMGAGRVIMLGTRPERLARMAGLGADALIAARGKEAVEQVKDSLGGKGADVVVEFAGTADAARQAIQLARRGGRVVLAGATGPGRELSGVDLSTIVRGHLDIYGSLANPKGVSRRGLELIARGAVDVSPLITHHFALADFAAAWDTFVQRRDGAIRVMLHPYTGMAATPR
ncbi:MAG: alcohol dehydrogenase catalytic domain-containing protein [Chloroflexi bacterium]|nr:alcohol dehydrogenase catalytic domain-containing protein [Chloroflexota bacterium]